MAHGCSFNRLLATNPEIKPYRIITLLLYDIVVSHCYYIISVVLVEIVIDFVAVLD